MKKILIFTIALMTFGTTKLYAQTVNDVPISEINVKYIQIVGTSRLLSNKVTIQIDFGQENKIFSTKDTQVKDKNGKLVVFNSMIDALNFLSSDNYQFVNAYAITIGSQNVYHYLLKKS